jgi:predicted PurR-regulated permease PerM
VLKKTWLIIAICYSLILAIFSLVNIDSLPKLGSDHNDKMFHVLAYGLLLLLWYLTFHITKIMKPVVIAAILSIIYGIVLEVLQDKLTIARNFDMLDIVANSIGVTIMAGFIIIKNKTIVKNL